MTGAERYQRLKAKRNADPHLAQKHRQYFLQYHRKWKAANKAKVRIRDSRQKAKAAGHFGIDLTVEQLEAFWTKTPKSCQICGERLGTRKRPDQLDHDHAKEKRNFRGQLCRSCNNFVGKIDKNPALLGRIQEYMLNPPGLIVYR